MAQGESKAGAYDDVLTQIVARLIDQLPEISASNCYFALDPDDLTSNPSSFIYVVSPVSGDFAEGNFVGGGIAALTTHSGCIVKIHSPSLVDKRKRDEVAIMGESRGVLRKASAVIAALSPTTADHPPQAGWVPRLGDYNLTSPFRPLGYAITKHQNDAIRAIEVTFGFEFDWDTTKQ